MTGNVVIELNYKFNNELPSFPECIRYKLIGDHFRIFVAIVTRTNGKDDSRQQDQGYNFSIYIFYNEERVELKLHHDYENERPRSCSR